MALQNNDYSPGGARATTGARPPQVGRADIAPFMGERGGETLGTQTLSEPSVGAPALQAPQVSSAIAEPTPTQMLNNIATATGAGSGEERMAQAIAHPAGIAGIDTGQPGRRHPEGPAPADPNPYANPRHYASSVAGHMDALLAEDSPYIERARTRAAQEANARGLQNSSMAAGAGEAAAIDQALRIAGPDASQRQALQRGEQQQYNALEQMGFSFSGQAGARYAEHVGSIQSRASADINAIATAPGIDQNVKQSLIENVQRQRDADLGLMDSIYEQMSAWNPGWTLGGVETNRPGVEYVPGAPGGNAPLADRFEPTPGGELPGVPGFEGAPGISTPGALPSLSEGGIAPEGTAEPGENQWETALGGVGAGLLADWLGRNDVAGTLRDVLEEAATEEGVTVEDLASGAGIATEALDLSKTNLYEMYPHRVGADGVLRLLPEDLTYTSGSFDGAAGFEFPGQFGDTSVLPPGSTAIGDTATAGGGAALTPGDIATVNPADYAAAETGIAAGDTASGGFPGLPPGTGQIPNLAGSALNVGVGSAVGNAGIPAAASSQIASQGGSLAAGLSGTATPAQAASAAAQISSAAPGAAAAAPGSWSAFLAGPGGAAIGAAIPLLFPALGMALSDPAGPKWTAAFNGLQIFREDARVDPATGRSQFGTTGNIDHAYVIPLPNGGIVHAASPPAEGYDEERMRTFNYELESNGISPWQPGFMPLLSHPGYVWDAVRAEVIPFGRTPLGTREGQWAIYNQGGNPPPPTSYGAGGDEPLWADAPAGFRPGTGGARGRGRDRNIAQDDGRR